MSTTYTGQAGCPCGGWGTHICPVPERTRPVFTVTRVSRRGGHIQSSRYTLAVSTVRPEGEPRLYTFGEIKQELLASALLDPATARNTILDAWCAGTARVEGMLAHTTAPAED